MRAPRGLLLLVPLSLGGCPRKPYVPPVKPPCDDTESCWIGCGEGKDADCITLLRLLPEQRRDDREISRSVGEAGCAAGAVTGCYIAGALWLRSEADLAEENAAALLDRGCSRLSAPSCALLGTLLADGRGVARDTDRAWSLARWSCERGEALGCRSAGLQVEREDPAAALGYFQAACDKGDAIGCTELGDLYDEGRGTAVDYEKARAAYERACQGGDELGCEGMAEVDDRVYPLEFASAVTFQIGFGGPPRTRSPRTLEEARARAQAALEQLRQGVPLSEVAVTFGDPPVEGTEGSLIEQKDLVRRKSASLLGDAVFALPLGGTTVLDDPSVGLLVVHRLGPVEERR